MEIFFLSHALLALPSTDMFKECSTFDCWNLKVPPAPAPAQKSVQNITILVGQVAEEQNTD